MPTPSVSGSSSDSEDGDAILNAEDESKPLTLEDDDSSPLLMPALDAGESVDLLGENDVDGEAAADSGLTDLPKPESEDGEAKSKKKRKRRKVLYICTVSCKYDVIRRVSKRLGFKEVAEDEDWNLYWTDFSVALERVMEMKRYQKINHFPGMSEICRKDLLARNMNRLSKQFPKEYNIFPRSWVLPADYGDFQSYARQKKNKTYILKPASGCQGRGIWLTKNIKDIKPHEHIVCQQYLSKPFLIDGFKFDLRVYVLVTSCDPFRIFVFKDGLARFATIKYHDPSNGNADNVFMHLTNYAINKTSENFIKDDEEGGSKRRITTINRWWKDNGHDVDKIWSDVDDVIIKTLISITDILTHNYRSCFPNHIRGSACFEILGFDVMFDRKLKPYVVEVNHSPSFHTDAKLDKEIKEALIYDTMNLINCGAVDKKKCIEEERKRIKERLFNRGPGRKETREELEVQQAAYLRQLQKYEDEHLGNFRRIYPSAGSEKYDKYFHSSGSLFQETAAYKARSEAARLQREEIRTKQEKIENILKKKKTDPTGLRPESPSSTRRRVKRPLLLSRRLPPSGASQIESSPSSPPLNSHLIDTLTPLDIVEEEELERISGLLQRDNLVRGLGIVEHVYRMLHCAPGMSGASKPLEGELQISNTDYGSSQSLGTLSNPSTSVQPKQNTFITTQRQTKLFQSLTQNATNPWQKPKGSNRKYGVEVDADRKSLVRNALSDVGSASLQHYARTMSGTSAAAAGKKNQSQMGVSIEATSQPLAITNYPYSNKVQAATTQHLSVISAPAPVMMRPDLPNSKKITLESALRTGPQRKTSRLKQLESGANTLVYS